MAYVHPTCHNCNPNQGGKPLCKLPLLKDEGMQGGRINHRIMPYTNTPHLLGAGLAEVIAEHRIPEWERRNYRVMVVSESPGSSEDRNGMPVSGRAAEILVRFLSRAGFDPEEVYVTCMVKCRPPKSRKPASAEMLACNQHLEHELKTFRPEVVILLGATSLKSFNLNRFGNISNIHGKLYTKTFPGWDDGPEFHVIPTLHPASFLHRHNPRLMNRVQDDYVFAKRVMDEGPTAKPYYTTKYTVCESLESVLSAVDEVREAGVFALDTESTGLGFRRSPMMCLQLSTQISKNWIIPFYRHDPEADFLGYKIRPQWESPIKKKVIHALKGVLEDTQIQKVAHNFKYDLNVVKWHLGCDIKGFLWDTMLMHHLLDSNPPHDLKFLADVEFACGDYDNEITKIVGVGREKVKSYDNIPDDLMYKYGAIDAEMTLRLYCEYYERLKKKPLLLNLYQNHVESAIRSFAKAEWSGSYVRQGILKQLGKEYTASGAQLEQKCRSLTTETFNPRSPKQIVDALIKMGAEEKIRNTEKSTGYSADKVKLRELTEDKGPVGDLALALLDYRAVGKLKSTYIDRIEADIDDDGRIRYGFNLHGTVNGRLSNRLLHQVPGVDEKRIAAGKPVIRSIFGEEDDFYYFYADYKQIEFIIFAYLSQDKDLIRKVEQGLDFHDITASTALGITIEEVSKFNRTNVGKRLNFGLVYGSKGYSLSQGEWEDRDGKKHTIGKRAFEFAAKFHETYPGVKVYLDLVPDQCRSRAGVLTSVFGRERMFSDINSSTNNLREKAEREAVNFTIQSPAGDIPIRTINTIDKILEQHDIGLDKIRLLNSVHDSVAYGVHKDYIDWFPGVFKIVAEQPVPEVFNKSFKIDMGWSPVSWTEAELSA